MKMCSVMCNRPTAFVQEKSSMRSFFPKGFFELDEQSKALHFNNLCHDFGLITLRDSNLLGLPSGHMHCNFDPIDSSLINIAWIAFVFQDEDGDTVLHRCIIQGKEEAVLRLIDACPDSNLLDVQNRLFQTALHLAVLTQQTTIVKRLVERGASVTHQDRRGDTVLHIVCRGEGDLDIAKVLAESQTFNRSLEVRNCEGVTCLHLSAISENLKLMQFLVEKNADVNARELKTGQTVLHRAAETGNLNVLTFLFTLPEVDINAVTYVGNTALETARGNCLEDIFMEMLYKVSKATNTLNDV
ncbi:hypothetical protein CHS0354_018714 [Potamilus streckersoni]|uniref:Uncharacterized protein n=1 Tax=Potamilus streckersoni TaxID=2493646 RepID=A0AAE0RQC8_9BIVA|nr:hypothetical protein CHS0354_018714 [Potamilus streckersoni]